MAHYPTSPLLDYLYQTVEESLQLVVQEWQNLPIGCLAQSPGPQQWSAAQCLEHLNLYSRYYHPALGQALAKTQAAGHQASPVVKSTWLGNMSVKSMLTGQNGRVVTKMQALKGWRPGDAPEPWAVVAEFIDHQERLLQLLEQARATDLNRAKVGISVAQFLKLRAGDALLFVVAHQCRHLLQAQRAVQQAGGPAIAFPRFELAEVGRPAAQVA
jgi:hypothetical protein